MLDLRLRYRGGGTFQTAGRLDYDLAETEFERGKLVRAKVSAPRSVRQNDFFHALIEAAWENQRGGPRLPTWRHLKAYLLIEAGHCTETRLPLGRMTSNQAAEIAGKLAGALRRQYDTAWVTYSQTRNEIILRFAKSVSFRAVDGDEMREITDKVVSLICTEIVPGMDPQSILDMARSKAA